MMVQRWFNNGELVVSLMLSGGSRVVKESCNVQTMVLNKKVVNDGEVVVS